MKTLARNIKWHGDEVEVYKKLARHCQNLTLRGQKTHVTDYIKRAVVEKMVEDKILK